jgi:hypothetical protein
MNQHLTEQQLIDYQFKLADAAGTSAAQAHLDECQECRQRLQKLARKFASLDLLRGEIEVSESLLSKTVENAVGNRGMGILPMSGFPNAIYRVWGPCRRAILALQVVVFRRRGARGTHGQDARATLQTPSQAHRGRVIWLYRVPALGAVAAAVIVGVAVLLVSNSQQNKGIAPTIAPGPLGQTTAPAVSADQESAFRKDQPAPLVAGEAGKAEAPTSSKPSSLKRSLAEAQPPVASEAPDRVDRAPKREESRLGSPLAPPEAKSAPGDSLRAEGPVRSVPGRGGKGVPPLRVEGIVGSQTQKDRVWGPLPSNRGQDARDTKNKAETASPQTPDGVTTSSLDATRMAEVPQVAEQPPFAPASAIELVVLPRRKNVQLTIYNGADLTLVRERRNLTLKRGWNWLQFMWANTLIDPTSLTLEPLEHKDGVQVQQLVFPPRLRELGRWLIRSEIGGQVPFELTYFTSGLAWRAFYTATLSSDERTMHLDGYVRISNGSGEDYEDAQTRLIVGRVHLLDEIRELAQRQYAYGSPSPIRGPVGVTGFEGADRDKSASSRVVSGVVAGQALQSLARKEIQKEGLSEYFLYTIEGTETIPNQWGKRLLSFEADDVPVTGLYKYDEERWGAETIRFLSFANDEKHKLGQTPIPDGNVRIYGRAGEQGHLSYVGAMNVKYIPVNEEVELNLGPARLVEVKPILMDYKVENHTFDNQGNISGWDEVRTWKVEIANTGSLPVDVELTRGFETPHWTLKPGDAAVSYEKYDVTHARFKLTIGPQSKRVFEYIVTTHHGTRQGALSNAK